MHDTLVTESVLQESDQPLLVDPVEDAPDISVKYPVHPGDSDPDRQSIERIVLTAYANGKPHPCIVDEDVMKA